MDASTDIVPVHPVVLRWASGLDDVPSNKKNLAEISFLAWIGLEEFSAPFYSSRSSSENDNKDL